MRGAVVDAQGSGAAADVDAEGLPGERLLEDPLAEVAGEKEAVRAIRPVPPGNELGDAEVLCFVDDGEVEGGRLRSPVRRGQSGEQARTGDQAARRRARPHPLEDRPEDRPLRSGSRVFRPSRATSRYASQLSSCQASTTWSHSVNRNCGTELVIGDGCARLHESASRTVVSAGDVAGPTLAL